MDIHEDGCAGVLFQTAVRTKGRVSDNEEHPVFCSLPDRANRNICLCPNLWVLKRVHCVYNSDDGGDKRSTIQHPNQLHKGDSLH